MMPIRSLNRLAIAALLLAACGEPPGPADDIPPATPPAFDASRFDDVDDPVWRAYLVLQDALAHDLSDESQRAAAALHDAADADLDPLTAAAAAAADIEALRVAFQPVSEALIERGAPPGFRVAYCPMAFDYTGARWVQARGHLMNPYFGARMLHCGAFEPTDGDA